MRAYRREEAQDARQTRRALAAAAPGGAGDALALPSGCEAERGCFAGLDTLALLDDPLALLGVAGMCVRVAQFEKARAAFDTGRFEASASGVD